MNDYPSLRQIIEGAIFAASSPISLDKILSLFEGDQPTREQIRDTLKKIEESCSERGFELKKVASGYRFQVRQEYSSEFFRPSFLMATSARSSKPGSRPLWRTRSSLDCPSRRGT